jgi:hypothetical protein
MMGIANLLKGIVRRPAPLLEIEGTIAEGPTVVEGKGTSHEIVVFRLNTNPDLEFRQELGPLSIHHRHGDRVRVQYQKEDTGVARVNWIETID